MGVPTKTHPCGFLIERLFRIEQMYSFLTASLKITSGEISAKETSEERIWAEQTPPAVLRAPDAPNYVFRENRLSNMGKMHAGCKIDGNLANDAET